MSKVGWLPVGCLLMKQGCQCVHQATGPALHYTTHTHQRDVHQPQPVMAPHQQHDARGVQRHSEHVIKHLTRRNQPPAGGTQQDSHSYCGLARA